MTDEIEQAQRILEGRCPACGHKLPGHSIVCDEEEFSRLLKLKNTIAKNKMINTLKELKEKKDV